MQPLVGVVKKYSGQGRRLGYPTANIEIPDETPEGLFLGRTELKGKKWPSIIFIGVPVTVGDTKKRAESYILDFPDHDLYGESIRLMIETKLRDNRKFDSVAELIKQMEADVVSAREYFKAAG